MNKRLTKKKYKSKHGINPPNKHEKALHALVNWMLIGYYQTGVLSEVEFLKRLQLCDLNGRKIAWEIWKEFN